MPFCGAQEYFDTPTLDKRRPVLGLWMVRGQVAGLCFREDLQRTTNNNSGFVPHITVPDPPPIRVSNVSGAATGLDGLYRPHGRLDDKTIYKQDLSADSAAAAATSADPLFLRYDQGERTWVFSYDPSRRGSSGLEALAVAGNKLATFNKSVATPVAVDPASVKRCDGLGNFQPARPASHSSSPVLERWEVYGGGRDRPSWKGQWLHVAPEPAQAGEVGGGGRDAEAEARWLRPLSPAQARLRRELYGDGSTATCGSARGGSGNGYWRNWWRGGSHQGSGGSRGGGSVNSNYNTWWHSRGSRQGSSWQRSTNRARGKSKRSTGSYGHRMGRWGSGGGS